MLTQYLRNLGLYELLFITRISLVFSGGDFRLRQQIQKNK